MRCLFEDEVVLSFLDGEPDTDIARIAEHLDGCPQCMQALEQSRKVDALLAAKTDTRVSEEVADRLLDLPVAAATAAPAGAGPSWRVAAAIAAAVLLGVTAFLAGSLGRDGSRAAPIARPGSPAPSQPRVAPAPEGNADVLEVPRGSRGPRIVTASAPVARAELERALRGRWVPGLTRSRVRAASFDVLRRVAGPLIEVGRDPRVAIAGRLAVVRSASQAGPVAEAHDVGLVAAAARWVLDGVASGVLSAGDMDAPLDALVASRGPMRRVLVDVFRGAPEVVRARLGRPIEARAAGAERARLVSALGALGAGVKMRRLAELPYAELAACAAQARRTGDRESLRFLTWLHVAVAARSPFFEQSSRAWFDRMPAAQRVIVSRVLDELVAVSSRRFDRERLEILQARLGGAEVALENP